jgi:uncharacterized protein YcbX
MPKVVRIWIYPIKSLDGLSLPSAQILPTGALQDDRRWAIYDEKEEVLNAKRSADFHTLRATYNVDSWNVDFHSEKTGEKAAANLEGNWNAAIDLFCRHFEQKVHVRENRRVGFPDDLDASGPTIISTGSIRRIAEWFQLPEAEVRRRFRANLEIDAEEPFWEDRLTPPPSRDASTPRAKVPFRIGQAHFWGVNLCQRCVVPTRDSRSGEPNSSFQKEFASRRAAEMPPGPMREQLDHFYRATINTQIDSASRSWYIGVGDELVVDE